MVFVLSSQGLSVLLQMTRFHYFYGWMISHSIYMNHVLFIHSSIDGRWSCFCILAIVNNAAVNTGLHISFQVGVFVSLDKYPEMKLLDLMEVLFLIFKGSSIFFAIIALPVYISTSAAKGCSFLHILANMLFTSILTSVRCYLIVFLICSSLMIRDVEHLFMYLLPTCISSLEKCLFSSSAYFIIRCFFFFLLFSCLSSLYILDINPFSDIWLADIFSLSVDCSSHFVNGFLYCAEAFWFVVVPFVCFCFLWFGC